MRIKKLHLQNFRGFENLEMTFPETSNLVVLIGKNGSGKSSVLEAIKCALGQITIGNGTHSLSIIHYRKYDTHETSIKCVLEHQEQSYSLGAISNEKTTYFSKDGGLLLGNIAQSIEDKNSAFPIMLCFPTQTTQKEDTMEVSIARKRAFDGCLSLNRQSSRDLLVWWEEQENIENEQRLDNNYEFRQRSLETTRKAITAFLNNLDSKDLFKDIRVNRRNNELNPDIVERKLIIKKQGEKLNFTDLSHGEKSIINIVAEIAKRLEIANPSDDALNGNGIVLIDEIDQHLHPEWQRNILPALAKTFPNVQFIVTTHSPQVLSSIPKEGVFILKDGKAYNNEMHTQGRDSNSLLREAFDIPKHEKIVADKLNAFYGFLDTKNKEAAQLILDELTNIWGENDAEIVRANLYFQDLLDEINDEAY